MKVAVYFEAKVGAHMVAQFDEEATYMACLPALEALAESKGYIVTESLDFDEPMTYLQDKANDAFYAWEIANNEQDLSDRDRMIWTAGWMDAQLQKQN